MAGRNPEKVLNNHFHKESKLFLESLKKVLRLKAVQNRLESSIVEKVQRLDTSVRLENQYTSQAENGRKSKIDLYYKSLELAIIIELKAGKGKKGYAGFRAAAQIAYYNKCLPIRHDLVVLVANEKGPDFDDFVETCLLPETHKNVVVITYDELSENGLNIPTI